MLSVFSAVVLAGVLGILAMIIIRPGHDAFKEFKHIFLTLVTLSSPVLFSILQRSNLEPIAKFGAFVADVAR